MAAVFFVFFYVADRGVVALLRIRLLFFCCQDPSYLASD